MSLMLLLLSNRGRPLNGIFFARRLDISSEIHVFSVNFIDIVITLFKHIRTFSTRYKGQFFQSRTIVYFTVMLNICQNFPLLFCKFIDTSLQAHFFL